jgi:hypothetical protein
MSAVHLEDVASATSDVDGPPFDVEVVIDDAEYARIMRRITIGGGGTGTDVCAFNSSI